MTVSELIKQDWVTLKNFADKNDLNFQMLRSALAGRKYKTISAALLKHGYINTADELVIPKPCEPSMKTRCEIECQRRGLPESTDNDLSYEQVIARQG